jgi:hypothetical protein
VLGSLLEQLEAREAAARTRVKALRTELDRLAEQVAAEEELLRRLEITKAMVSYVLAGGDDDEVGVVIDPGPNPEGGVGDGGAATSPRCSSMNGRSLTAATAAQSARCSATAWAQRRYPAAEGWKQSCAKKSGPIGRMSVELIQVARGCLAQTCWETASRAPARWAR